MPPDHEDEVDRLLAEQVAYYRARASEYDGQMWAEDRYDEAIASEVRKLERWVARLPVRGRVLELACGSGRWTPVLAAGADELVALDAAPEMLEIARSRGAGDNVEFVLGDVFELELEGTFDLVFFSFLLSHVPPQRADRFWAGLVDLLTPDGVVAFIDASPGGSWHEATVDHPTVPLVERELSDGSRHRVVKVFHDPRQLQRELESVGWDATVGTTGETFVYGTARRGRRSGG